MHKEYNYHPFLDNLLLGNRDKCLNIAYEFIDNESDIKVFYEEILTKALYEVGLLWENHKISIATEHLASAVAESIVNDLYLSLIRKETVHKTAIITCVENEFHQLGARMVSDVFEMNGWNAHSMGVNTTIEDMLSFLESAKPDILAISLTLYFNRPYFEDMLEKIKARYPEQTVIAGGQAFANLKPDIVLNHFNVRIIKNLLELETFIKKINE